MFSVQVLSGILELVPELAKDHLALSNCLFHDETHWLVLVIFMAPVLRLGHVVGGGFE